MAQPLQRPVYTAQDAREDTLLEASRLQREAWIKVFGKDNRTTTKEAQNA